MTTPSADRPTVLIVNGHYIPAFKAGGPPVSLSNMVRNLSHKINFKVIAQDRDIGDTQPFETAKAGTWVDVGAAKVRYLSPEEQAPKNLVQEIVKADADLIYLNSFFDFRFTLYYIIWRRLRGNTTPVLLAPRGQLSKGALSIRSTKKRFFLKFARMFKLFDDVVFHASTDLEREEITALLGPVQVKTAINIPRTLLPENSAPLSPRQAGAPIKLVFASRIHEKKNVLGAISFLKQADVPAIFTIIGVIDDKDHWKQCEALINELPEHIQVNWHSPVQGAELGTLLYGSHIFLMPTLGENFGHAIFEALSCGVPPLISDQTPWLDLEEKGCGRAYALSDPDAFIGYIRHVYETPELDATRQSAALAYAEDFLKNSDVISDSLKLFETTTSS